MQSKLNKGLVFAGGFASAFFGLVALAGATATYDLTPVTSDISSELAANIPVILGVIGALIALGVGLRMLKRFVHV